MQKESKTVAESRAEQVQWIMPQHINGSHRLFGGMLMQWIDVVAGVVARRHSNAEVTTACVDNLRFKEAVYVNSTIVLIGEMTYVGNTSMEVRVDTFVEDIMGMRRSVNRAYVVLVALDDNENPIEVPGLLIQTEKEKFEWEAGKKRYELRKKRRVERF